MDTDELKYWVAFSRIPTVGRARVALMEGYFGSLEKAWQAGSGELAAAGLDQRSVKAVPGSILSPASRESNRLIQDGAKTVLGYTDVLEELNFSAVGQQMELHPVLPPALPEDGQESQLLACITYEPVHIDDIQRASGLPVSAVSSSLAMMEIKGMVKKVGGMNYIKAREASVEYQVARR